MAAANAPVTGGFLLMGGVVQAALFVQRAPGTTVEFDRMMTMQSRFAQLSYTVNVQLI